MFERDAEPATPETDPSKLSAKSDELGKQGDSKFADLSARRRHNAGLGAVALPFEMLEEIFAYACAPPPQVGGAPLDQDDDDRLDQDKDDLYDREDQARVDSHHLRRARCSVASICHRWRVVVLDMTLLWNYIRLDVSLPTSPESTTAHPVFTPSLDLLPLELHRAKTRPLHLQLCVRHQLLEMPQQLLEVIRKVFPLCVTISVVFDDNTPFMISLEEPGSKLSLLRALRMEAPQFTGGAPVVVDLSLTPALRRLFVSQPIKPPADCPNLTQLHLGFRVPLSNAISVLQVCSQLRQLQWELPVDSETYRQYSSRDPLHLPFLEKLYLGLPISIQEGPSAFSLIVAPRLSSLVLHEAVEMIPRHFPSVRHLRCDATLRDMNHILESLPCFPELEELDVEGISWTDSAVESLSRRGPDGKWTLVPHLKRVVWGSDFIDPESDMEGVRRLLEARSTVQQGDERSVSFILDSTSAVLPPLPGSLPLWVTMDRNVRSQALSPVDDASTW